MKEQNILGFGAVDLVKNPIESGPLEMKCVREFLEPILQSIGFTEAAPFRTIVLIFNFGIQNGEPKFRRISKKYSELPAVLEIDAFSVAPEDSEFLKKVLYEGTLKVLKAAAEKYNLPYAALETELAKEKQSCTLRNKML